MSDKKPIDSTSLIGGVVVFFAVVVPWILYMVTGKTKDERWQDHYQQRSQEQNEAFHQELLDIEQQTGVSPTEQMEQMGRQRRNP